MKTKSIFSALLMVSLFTQANAREILPAEDSPSSMSAEYRPAFLNETYFNRLPISGECSLDVDVNNGEKNTLIGETEAQLSKLINFQQERSLNRLPNKKPTFLAAFMLKLIILKVNDISLVEQTVKNYNQVTALYDSELKETGLKRLVHQMRDIISAEVKVLNTKIDQDEKTLDETNLALLDFLKVRAQRPVPVTLVGLKDNEKAYFQSMQSNFEIARCQMLKKQIRLENLEKRVL